LKPIFPLPAQATSAGAVSLVASPGFLKISSSPGILPRVFTGSPGFLLELVPARSSGKCEIFHKVDPAGHRIVIQQGPANWFQLASGIFLKTACWFAGPEDLKTSQQAN